MSNTEVLVTIYAKTTSWVKLSKHESIKSIQNRGADIHLHGGGIYGHIDTLNLGSDELVVERGQSEKVLVDKGLLLALLDTANRTTELESIYDDSNGTSYKWENIGELMYGISVNVNRTFN